MTFRTVPTTSRSHPYPDRIGVALALAIALTCSGLGQEPVPDIPAPAIPPGLPDAAAKLPESGEPGMPDDGTLTPELPPGAIPVRDFRRIAPQNLEDWMAEEAAEPTPVTESPTPETFTETNPDFSRDVAMNQALSTGESLLGSLGGLDGVLTSPFLIGAPFIPGENSAGQPLRPIRVGSLDLKAHATLGVVGGHVNGLQTGEDFSTSGLFQGGLTAQLGRSGLSSLWLSYDIGVIYPKSAAQSGQGGGGNGSSGLDQSFSLMAKIVFPELRRMEFLLGVKYASLSGLERDSGTSSKRQIATASFTTNYRYSAKTSFNCSFSVPVRSFSDAVSSSGVTSTLFVTNEITRKSTVGLGYTYGTLDVDNGNDQVFQQVLVRTTYAPSRFVLFDGTVGIDFRDQGDTFSTAPIFGLSATWDSRQGTSVSLAAERRIFNAASSINTNFTSSSIVLRLGQRLRWGVIGLLSGGYDYTEYDSTGSGGQGGRIDKLSYFSATLVKPMNRHWNCALNVSVGKNESEVRPFDYFQTTFKTSLEF